MTDPLSLIDGFVVLGAVAILPLALPSRWWALAAGGAVVALALPESGGAALFVVPWVGVGVGLTAAAVWSQRDRLRRWRPRWSWRSVTPVWEPAVAVVAPAYATVAGLALAQSRLGLSLFGVREPIVELTAVHFTYAGAGALMLARFNLARAPGRTARLGVVATAAAPPVVALGFVTGAAVPQVGGAVLMTVGVWATGVLHLRAAVRPGRDTTAARVLLGISGASVWLPMVLAVAWAAAQHWQVRALSIADMVRVHGVANALGFTLCGLIAGRLLPAPPEPVEDRGSVETQMTKVAA